MREINRHFLATVLEDLDFIDKSWGDSITEAEIRRSSPVLRYLLVEGKIKEAGAMLQQRIRILSPLSSFVENIPKIERLRFYMSGGATVKMGSIEHYAEYTGTISAAEVKRMYDADQKIKGHSKAITVDQFLNQASFIYGASRIKRKTVIKYICNKLGGTHYDSKRLVPSSYSTNEVEEQYAFLDDIYATRKAMDMNMIHLEVLGIGQRFIKSRDVMIFKAKNS
ncbi:MAG: hypothetical protein ISR95_03630 [Candidatus Marinimicrobia bacterium]|nr:hypothetical protein [Candidatus Brocadiales bacterium]MBL7046704.1 hypothetical protein [Candidatus Neomarinimicrobiota bacterium]